MSRGNVDSKEGNTKRSSNNILKIFKFINVSLKGIVVIGLSLYYIFCFMYIFDNIQGGAVSFFMTVDFELFV